MKCVNENCNKYPLNNANHILVNEDGDFACDEYCKTEYEKQRDNFFANIGNNNWYYNWFNSTTMKKFTFILLIILLLGIGAIGYLAFILYGMYP